MSPSSPSRRTRRPRRRTRLSTEQVRARLYEGALARFRDQGYDATSVSELTREAGVAKGTFFNHFPTKEHILAAWFGGVWEEEADRQLRLGTGGGDAVVEQFEGVMRRLEEDPILSGALAARIGDLPAWKEDPASGTSFPPLLDAVRAWLIDRIRETLPFVVPIRPVQDPDLAALLAGALVETLREAFLSGESQGARDRLVARADFLLASAGLRS